MAMQFSSASPFGLDSTLFPDGISPGSLIELRGSGGSGKTYLITYLLAKFVACNPSKKAVLIDTTSQFSQPCFIKILSSLLAIPEKDRVSFCPQLSKHLERIIVIQCFSGEDLLFCFGPKNAGELSKLLQLDPEISIVFMDCLNNHSFCPSLNGSNAPVDIFDLLRRSVSLTKTPVFCTVADTFRPMVSAIEGEKESKAIIPEEQFGMFTYNTYSEGKSYFTHSIILQRLKISNPIPFPIGGRQSQLIEFLCKVNFLSKKDSKTSASSLNYRVKFSIVGGVLKWLSVS